MSKRLIPRRPPIRKMTTRFMLLYGFLALLPAIAFIVAYSSQALSRQRQEIFYQEKLFLTQTAAALNQTIVSMSAVADTLTMNAALMDMLENAYPTASDELMACIRLIQPALTQTQASHTGIRAVYIYRYEKTFLTDSDLLFSLPMAEAFPYDISWMTNDDEPGGMLVAPGDSVRYPSGEGMESALYSSFTRVFDRAYSRQVGVIETQLDMDKALAELGIPEDRGLLILKAGERLYPIRFTAMGPRLHTAPVNIDTLETSGTLISEPIGMTGMALIYLFDPAKGLSVLGTTASMALLLLLPTLLAYGFIYKMALRLSRFGQHIERTDASSPTAYARKQPDDELGDVVAAYNALAGSHKALLEQVRSAEQMKNAATYYAMSSQVNPHFMFNTLENIRMQIEMERYADATQMLQVLARFLRYNISLRQESNLEFELSHIERYLMIYQYRMRDMFRFSVNRPDGVPLDKVRCPFCMLQPLAENCLRHGIRDEQPLVISVSIKQASYGWLLAIEDNGSGIKDDEIAAMNASLANAAMADQPDRSQVGLINVNSRIKYFYGADYGLSLSANNGGGLTVMVRIGGQGGDTG